MYRSGNQLLTVSYAVDGNTFVAEKPRVWIAGLGADLGGIYWHLAPDGKRVAAVIPEGSASRTSCGGAGRSASSGRLCLKRNAASRNFEVWETTLSPWQRLTGPSAPPWKASPAKSAAHGCFAALACQWRP